VSLVEGEVVEIRVVIGRKLYLEKYLATVGAHRVVSTCEWTDRHAQSARVPSFVSLVTEHRLGRA
jgi:hypothetical protein